ncbi:hypothetical protein SAMN05660479_02467 [Microbulbifer thermotolerans]|nr:hypothetical protein SAMN05660479_02467 [Microbulbifer thermotolerans]
MNSRFSNKYPAELQGSTRAFSKYPSYCLSAPEPTIGFTRINQRFPRYLTPDYTPETNRKQPLLSNQYSRNTAK